MVLKTRHWGPVIPQSVVCVHGVAQHSGVFEDLAQRLAAQGHSVVAVDLRGHGESDREPPWNVATHVHDLLDTLDVEGIERATWVGHSFGGVVVAALASEETQRARGVVLLDPGFEIPPDRALRNAEIERLDWSFATLDGAVNALMSSELMTAAPRDVVTAFVRDDVRKGPDGRFRFRFSPGAAVVAYSEMALPAPPIASLPTLLVLPELSLAASSVVERYREVLGEALTIATVPNGHNVLWESPAETLGAVELFLVDGVASPTQ